MSEAATSNHADGKRLLRRFKTRFHLARDARLDLSSGALSLGIQVSISPPEMSSTLSAPPTIETNRLASLVGAFVDPNGGLWYQRVLAAVRDLRLATGVPWQEETAARLVKPLESSSVILQYNDLELTERDLYLIVAKGTFFAEIEPEKSVYEDLTRAPLVHQMLHFHFLSFTDRVFDVCDELYQLCRGLDLSEGGASADLDDSERRCCIYCLNEEGAFSRPEHVFSEALGNDEIILEPGSVCDSCNHGVLATLDEYLVNHDVIAPLRAQFVEMNPKTGKFSVAKGRDYLIERTGPRHIAIRLHSRKPGGLRIAEADGLTEFGFTATGRRKFDSAMLGRALFKVGLGLIAWKHGTEVARHPRYDPARAFIIGKAQFPNYLLMSSRMKPVPFVRSTIAAVGEGTSLILEIFGVIFVFNLEPTPVVRLVPELHEEGFVCHALFAA